MPDKSKFLQRFNKIIAPKLFDATIFVQFNEPLVEDPDGKYAIFYTKEWDTVQAESIFDGSTYKNPSISHLIRIPKTGKSITIIALGLIIATYTKTEKVIFPGETRIHVVAEREFNYDEDSDFGDDDDDTSHPNYFLRNILNIPGAH